MENLYHTFIKRRYVDVNDINSRNTKGHSVKTHGDHIMRLKKKALCPEPEAQSEDIN